MKKILAVVFAVGVLTCLFLSCGGGSSGGVDLSLSDLEGSWLGSYYVLYDTMNLVFDSTGQVTDILFDGSSSSVTGTTSQLMNNHFGLEITGLSWGMFVDDAAQHALMNMDMVGGPPVLLEKGATVIPTYEDEDVLGSWSGAGYAYSDTLGEMVRVSPVTLTITDNLLFYAASGSFDGETILGAVSTVDPSTGFCVIDFSLEGSVYTGLTYLSPDKTCLGIEGYIGAPSVYPDDLTVMLLNRD